MLKVIEIGHGKDFHSCWENERGDRFKNGSLEYSYRVEFGFRSFTYRSTDYEYDEETNRYYYLTESIDLRPEMDGAMVRRRIRKSAYMEVYRQLLEYLGLNEKEEVETGEETETVETTEICPECETEVEVKSDTLRAECPVCRRKLMLCSVCRTVRKGDCDYDTATDTCRFDSS